MGPIVEPTHGGPPLMWEEGALLLEHLRFFPFRTECWQSLLYKHFYLLLKQVSQIGKKRLLVQKKYSFLYIWCSTWSYSMNWELITICDWNIWCPIELNGQNIRLNHFECLVVFMLMFQASKVKEMIFDGDI